MITRLHIPPMANDSVTERPNLTGGKTAKYFHWQT